VGLDEGLPAGALVVEGFAVGLDEGLPEATGASTGFGLLEDAGFTTPCADAALTMASAAAVMVKIFFMRMVVFRVQYKAITIPKAQFCIQAIPWNA